jgi:ribonuclease R
MVVHVGRRLPGRVTRVKPFGLFVQLDGTLVEGVIPLAALPQGPYQPDARETCVASASCRFSVGMPLEVTVISADELRGRIEFVLAE